jgi:pseudaminic acid cytidylyltransferase
MNICIIPARGGSKRIPRKNIKPFCGKPMIAWSIEAAQASSSFDRIVVSTEDAEIAELAKQWGAEVPFMRPLEFSDDHTGTAAVIAHGIDWFASQGEVPDKVCCLYATAPFVTAEDIRRGGEILECANMRFAFSATTFAYPVFRALLHSGDGVRMIFPEHFSSRSQDLPEAIHDAGQFYWGTPGAWLEEQTLFSDRSVPIMLSRHRVQDIDTMDDWRRAEVLWQVLQAEAGKENVDG